MVNIIGEVRSLKEQMEQNERIQEVLKPRKRKASLSRTQREPRKQRSHTVRQWGVGRESLQITGSNSGASPKPFLQGVEATHSVLTSVLRICWVIDKEDNVLGPRKILSSVLLARPWVGY